MSFSEMLGILQEKNKQHVVLIKIGVFYIATGKDAIFLSKQLCLKCVCYKKEICKIGIPEGRIEYYLRKLEKLNIAYVVYDFNGKNETLIQRYIHEGLYHKEEKDNKNCLICKGIRGYAREDKYLIALQKLQEEELEKRNGK